MAETVLYLHGFASGPSSSKAAYFREQFRREGLELTIPDLNTGAFQNLTISGQLSVVDEYAGGRPISLIGSSMGGYVAAQYAFQHVHVQKLLLLAPAFGFVRRWAESLGEQTMREWKARGALDVYHYGERRTRSLGYQLITDAAQYDDYPDFHQPALIFHGERDTTVPVAYSQHFAATHANARLEIVDSGHELLDVLEEIWRQAKGFLLG